MRRLFRILDLDNCISDDGWRIPEIQWQHTNANRRYHNYHLLAPWDRVANCDLFTGLDLAILIFTSRPTHYRRSTEHWLRMACVPYVHMLMRSDEDHRSSVEVKRTQLIRLMNYYSIRREWIEAAYDDRPEICAMYREFGLRACERSIHGISAYHNPLTGINHATGQKA